MNVTQRNTDVNKLDLRVRRNCWTDVRTSDFHSGKSFEFVDLLGMDRCDLKKKKIVMLFITKKVRFIKY